MRKIEMTEQEAELVRYSVTRTIDEYAKAIRTYNTAEYAHAVSDDILEAWKRNAEVLRKVKTKLV